MPNESVEFKSSALTQVIAKENTIKIINMIYFLDNIIIVYDDYNIIIFLFNTWC